MPVRVITDSAAALGDTVAARLDITVVPILITLGDVTYRDGELPLEVMLENVDRGVSTSGPAPGAFLEALRADGNGAVVVTVAASLSSTFKSASLAGEEMSEQPVRVVDTGSAAGAQALVAVHAAAVARAGGTVDEVAAAAEHVADRVRLLGALDTLEFLVRSGRVSGLVGGMAGTLGIRPLFELTAGEVTRLRPALGREAAMRRLLRIWRRSRRDDAALHCAAVHADAEEDAHRLLGRVAAEIEPATALVTGFGPGMIAHAGPGVVGLAWWWEDGR